MSLTPKNWESFQHYKDRSPAWIKLHRGLLDNVDYFRLSPEAGKALPLIWLIASEKEGAIPDISELAFRLRISDDLAADILTELAERGFLVDKSFSEPAEQGATLAQRIAKSNGFGSRHISDETKRIVWARDGGVCQKCGTDETIEFDHKHPVSKGGSSDQDNIQLLCRPCNRAKRASLATPAQPPRSLEKEKEKQEKIEKKETREIALLDDDWPQAFKAEFWEMFPNKVGKADALAVLERVRKRGVSWELIVRGLISYIRDKPPDRPWCNPATWLRQDRWEDQPANLSKDNGKTGDIIAAADNLVSIIDSFGGRPREADAIRSPEGAADVWLLPQGGS